MIHRRRGTFATLAFSVGALAVHSSALGAEAREPLAWNPEWPAFRPIEYVLTGVAGALSAAAYYAVKDPERPRWTGGVAFDDGARDALRLHSRSGRAAIQRASDVMAAASAVLVLGVDSLIVPLARDSDFVALQLVLMDAESYVFSTLINTTLSKATGRARPSFAACQRDPTYDAGCDTEPTASFPSGHANAAFTAAGLSCVHHAHLALYGSPSLDAVGCGTAVTLAVATSVLRIMGDRHYASDVLVGGGLGFAAGFAGPLLLHYDVPGRSGTAIANISAIGGTSRIGFIVSGRF